MPINSKAKGKRGELAIVHKLKEAGYDVHRTAQHMGKNGGVADVEGLPYIHIEVKNTERLNLYEALKQAIRDNGDKPDLPTVFHKRNNEEWVTIMRLSDWLKLYEAYRERRKSEEAN